MKKKASIITIILITLIAVIIFLRFGNKAASEDILTSRLSVREWGVFICEGEKTFSEMKNHPSESNIVKKPTIAHVKLREPVIYFDAEGIDSLDVSVTITSGKPDITYPYARHSGSTASWSVQFTDSITIDDSLSTCLKENIHILNNVQATPLTVNGVRARSLFYEGVNQYQNRLTIIDTVDNGIGVKNDNEYPLFDVWLFRAKGSPAYIDTLYPGKGTLLYKKQSSIVCSEMKNRFPQDEIDAFKAFWSSVNFTSVAKSNPDLDNDRSDTRFFYRLPQNIVDSLLPLTLSVKPTSITRIIHILAFPEVKKASPITNFPFSNTSNNGITGNRRRATIMRTLRKNMLPLKNMYDTYFASTNSSGGNVTVKWTIDEKGAVISCKVIASTLNERNFERKIIEHIQSIEFGMIDSPGDVTEVVYPFIFSKK